MGRASGTGRGRHGTRPLRQRLRPRRRTGRRLHLRLTPARLTPARLTPARLTPARLTPLRPDPLRRRLDRLASAAADRRWGVRAG
ncbi:hypothetical protein E6R62_26965 [Streptomyces sp. A1136]|nr:hypothetical protein E6R62_26965 [Streptomyces sp. A1136]